MVSLLGFCTFGALNQHGCSVVRSMICNLHHYFWIAAREKVVGWYSTGPRLREADLDITELMTNYCDTPLLVICEVQVSNAVVSHVCNPAQGV